MFLPFLLKDPLRVQVQALFPLAQLLMASLLVLEVEEVLCG